MDGINFDPHVFAHAAVQISTVADAGASQGASYFDPAKAAAFRHLRKAGSELLSPILAEPADQVQDYLLARCNESDVRETLDRYSEAFGKAITEPGGPINAVGKNWLAVVAGEAIAEQIGGCSSSTRRRPAGSRRALDVGAAHP
jgi:hypothetical protein